MKLGIGTLTDCMHVSHAEKQRFSRGDLSEPNTDLHKICIPRKGQKLVETSLKTEAYGKLKSSWTTYIPNNEENKEYRGFRVKTINISENLTP